MAIEAFVWFYRDQEPAAIEVATLLGAFEGAVASWDPASGRLGLDFGGASETCEAFMDPQAAQLGQVRGLAISRPTRSPKLWLGVLELMAAHHGLLFFSDDTTPRFRNLDDTLHYPIDLLRELGTPIKVASPTDLLTRRSITEPV